MATLGSLDDTGTKDQSHALQRSKARKIKDAAWIAGLFVCLFVGINYTAGQAFKVQSSSTFIAY